MTTNPDTGMTTIRAFCIMKALSLALVWLKPAFLRSKIVNQGCKKQISENIDISTS